MSYLEPQGIVPDNNTFTPTIIGSTTAGVGTYSTQYGSYMKIGKLVVIQAYLVWTAHTGTGSGMRIAGLPFSSENTTNMYVPVTLYSTNISALTNNIIQGYMLSNTTQVTLQQYPAGGGAASNLGMDTAGTLMVGFAYRAA